MKLIEEVE
jgi:hypothetical protein